MPAVESGPLFPCRFEPRQGHSTPHHRLHLQKKCPPSLATGNRHTRPNAPTFPILPAFQQRSCQPGSRPPGTHVASRTRITRLSRSVESRPNRGPLGLVRSATHLPAAPGGPLHVSWMRCSAPQAAHHLLLVPEAVSTECDPRSRRSRARSGGPWASADRGGQLFRIAEIVLLQNSARAGWRPGVGQAGIKISGREGLLGWGGV